MIFQDVYANYHARTAVWEATPPQKVVVNGWRINLGESNAGTLQVVCAGIETFGRALLGYTVERKSQDSFVGFIETYFPPMYRGRGTEIYSCFRCGLLHSHFIGHSSSSGFFMTRDGTLNTHLHYTNISGTAASSTKDAQLFRLVLDINVFTADFQRAVEDYLKDVENAGTKVVAGVSINLESNLKASLKDFPLETADVYELPQ